MAAPDQAFPTSAAAAGSTKPSAVDEAGKWFWNFLKDELTPYPGRLWIVGRVTIAASIVMVLVMTFQIPGGFLGAIFTLFISRENPIATFKSGAATVGGFLAASLYTVLFVRLLVDDPLTHFLWVALSLFLSFFLLHTVTNVAVGTAFGFMVAGAIPTWDQTTISVDDRFENTLWLAGVVIIGVVVSVVVEYVFRRVHPATDLTEGIEERLKTVENVLRSAATGTPLETMWQKRLSLYASVGSSRLRRLITRSEFSSHFKAQMSAAVALIGRMVDIAASFRLALAQRTEPMNEADRQRLMRLAEDVSEICQDLVLQRLPSKIPRPMHDEPSSIPFLPTMERTLALIPDAFAGSQTVQEFVTAPLDEERRLSFFVNDAFTNREHLLFALRGTLAAVACYFIYNAIDWRGLSTSVATCFITALSTVGSSRQKQILRLGGAIIGGIIFGMGAQVFVLPYLDSITGFTVLFALVTAISAWIGTASGRLSYLGVQLALAFYVINLQEFTIQTSLGVARDRVFGVLLGLMSMWLFVDRLGVKSAVDEMQAIFARNLEMFAELTEQLLEKDQVKAIRRVRQLRDQLNDGFGAVRAQSDAILFEFGLSRRRKMQIREDVRRWQPSIRTLLLVQITAIQYLAQKPLTQLPEPIADAGVAFEKDVARVMHAMASEVKGTPASGVPDIRGSAVRVQEEVRRYYQDLGTPIPAQASDVVGLSESLATIIAPLYEDIHDTFAAHDRGIGSHIQLAHGQA
jgi:multidrug resistance protein MdtO